MYSPSVQLVELNKVWKKFKEDVMFNTTFRKCVLLDSKLECACVKFYKGNFMSKITKIIDGAERIVRL